MLNNWRELLLGPVYFYHKNVLSMYRKNCPPRKSIHAKPTMKILFKKDYCMELEKFEYRIFHFLTRKISTGGSTGAPFKFYRSIFDSIKERAYIFDIWS